MQNYQILRNEERGYASHKWLQSHHSFSFAHYYHPKWIHFGALRVINDDIIEGGQGFGAHPHDNMEIISIPLSGDLEHKDSVGNHAIIKSGDIQVMSAGTGIIHSEYNANKNKPVNFLQIWIFPHTQNVTPRYQQKTIDFQKSHNHFLVLLAPAQNSHDTVWIHQDAWISLATIDSTTEISYQKYGAKNGVYCFVLEGGALIRNEILQTKDAIMFEDLDHFTVTAQQNGAKILILEVPMK